MKRAEIIKFIIYVIFFIGVGILVLIPVDNGQKEQILENEILKATITGDLGVTEERNGDYTVKTYKYLAVITEGQFKDKVVEVKDNASSIMSFHIPAEKGDDILIYPEMNESGTEITEAFLSNFRRDKHIKTLIIIFIALILIIGGMKGIKSLLSLAVTGLLVLRVFLPRVINGQDPILWSVIVAVLITLVTMMLVSGINKKSFAAILGTLGGVLLGAVIAIIVSYKAKIIGFSFQDAQSLLFLPQGTSFNFNGLMFATILLGALGAVMDVAMSISSSIFELKSVNKGLNFKELFRSGMHIGRDVMGTMINTLILAYVGSSMHILIIVMAYNIEIYNIINNDQIVTEILRSFAGTIGLIAAIPLTAVIAALLDEKEEIE